MNLDFFRDINSKLSKKETPKVDLHIHTNWTDGKDSVNKIFKVADKLKLKHIFFSEHSRKDSGNWFFNFKNEIIENNLKFNCKGIIGTEVKILNNHGDLDISDNILEQSELVMASVHRFPGEKGNILKISKSFNEKEALRTEYSLSMVALDNPQTNILGHPFGMSLKRFKIIPPKKLFIDLIKKAAKKDKIFEINIRYHHNILELIELCIKYDCLISLGSNAHSTQEIGLIYNYLKRNYEKN
jgi:histidinol phosphatase-like PHP family hydrolase